MNEFYLMLCALPDTRYDRHKLHRLADIVYLAIFAILAGADTWDDIWEICDENLDFLRGVLRLENGIPSITTFRRVMSRVDPKRLINILQEQAYRLSGEYFKEKTVAFDGKTVRGSRDGVNGKDAIHCLSAYCTENHTVIRQIIGSKKESEITMLPAIISEIDLSGATVTIDAIGCQKTVTDAIIGAKADYMIALKDNQKTAKDDVEKLFEDLDMKEEYSTAERYVSYDGGHGRVEERIATSICLKDKRIESLDKFQGIQSVVKMTSIVDRGQKRSVENRYYISSHEANAKKQAGIIRSHWAIENSLHYVLDVIFDEDASRSRKDHLADNLSTLRKLAMNILSKERSNATSKKKPTFKSLRRKCLMNLERPLKLIQEAFGKQAEFK
ncbi:MAG: ISAs1 family transposase [Lachnospiraceae bacterium]|nr:ISAs1 family transposase [Lachnospiraceae bacterium]